MSPKKNEQEEKKKYEKTGSKGQRLPILWETVNTFSKIIITLLGISVAGISYYSGSGFLMSAFRAGAAMIGVGFILWLIYWRVAKGSITMMAALRLKQDELNNQSRNIMTEYKV